MLDSTGPADWEMVLAVQARSEVEARLRRALESCFAGVWRTLRGLGLPAARADDAAQHVFMVLADRLADVEPGKERAFLLATAVRVASNERRAHARRPEDPSDCVDDHGNPGLNPEELIEVKEARQVLDQILCAMPPEQRAVFVLFELEQLTLAEVATTVNVARGTVASRLRAARAVFDTQVKRHRAAVRNRGGLP